MNRTDDTTASGPFHDPYHDGDVGHHVAYLSPVVMRVAAEEAARQANFRIFDLGAGNGSWMKKLASAGYDITGVEPTESGVAIARAADSSLKIYQGSSDNDLVTSYGKFQMVISLEVIEHVYLPSQFATTIYSLLEPGGLALISTPYHGYWKNLVLALSGKLDAHFSALWDGGHIKFWSMATLGKLLLQTGFESVTFERVGRIPPLAKSMIALARKPA